MSTTVPGALIAVRDAISGDEDGIAEVMASATATLRQTYRPNKEALEHKQRIAADRHRLIAECQGRIIGTAQWHADGDAMRILGLGVVSDFRRQGVARLLVSRVADLARERGFASVVTRTVVETGNVPIFKALGFEVFSEHPDGFSESKDGSILTEAELRMSA